MARPRTGLEHRGVGMTGVLLVGYGLAGAWFHDPLVTATPGLSVAGVVTSRPEAAALARRRHPGVRVHGSVADALRDGSLDAGLVVVATPNASHAAITREALQADRAVVVDKPLAPTLDAAHELVALARRRGLPLSVFHNRRWDGDFLTIQRLVGDGSLGQVHRLESRFDRWRPVAQDVWRSTATSVEGGGLLLDLGSHLVDQALVLFGPVEAVYAELAHRRGQPADDDVFIALHHGAGRTSHLHASALAGAATPRFRVSGDGGTYVKHGLDVQEAALRATGVAVPGESGVEPQEAWGRLHRGDDGVPVPTQDGDWTAYYRGVRDHLAGAAPLPVSADDGLAVLRVIEAARTSAADREVVALR